MRYYAYFTAIDKRRNKMEYKTLIDDYFRKVPEYYPEMYQDGFTPEEIMYAFRKQMRRQAEDERPVKINFSSEVKIKR